MRPGVVLILALAAGACADRRSPAGFRLPPGDPDKGKAVFAEMRCHACHRVDGEDFPAPVADPVVPVVLGGQIAHARTDGELVTAIINPSHKLAPGYARELIARGDRSRMPDYAEIMTVRQMTDLVAFLQSRYEVIRPGAAAGASGR